MVSVHLYVEGGGDSPEQHARCREGFRKLLEKAGFAGRMPRIVAGGGRSATFDRFRTATRASAPDNYPVLLVDSEEPVPGLASPWTGLQTREGWERPAGVTDEQAQLMVTCMETWLIADRAALRGYFKAALNENALPPLHELEQRSRQDVQEALENATRLCGRERQYRKGKRSYQVLAALQPATLRQHLPHFQRLIETLNRYLH